MKRLVLCAYSVAAALLCGQTPPQTPPTPAQTPAQAPAPAQTPAPAESAPRPPLPKTKHFLIGLRARAFPVNSLSTMANRSQLTTTTTPAPVRDWSFDTASHSPHWSGGPAIEFVPNRNWSVSLEVLYDRLRYTKVTSIAWGTDDPTTTTDERTHMFRNEDTRAVLWDVPIMVHYRGLRPTGVLSRMYLAAGAVGRTVANISTSTTITYPDTSTGTSKIVAPPSKRNLLGGVIGIGFRIVDDFNINWTPEIRYTRWAGSTFGTDSTVSPRNQLEVSMGFTF